MWNQKGGNGAGNNPEKKSDGVTVAIDKDKGSQYALKWAVDHLLSRGQTVTLLHVKQKPSTIPTPMGSQVSLSEVHDEVAKACVTGSRLPMFLRVYQEGHQSFAVYMLSPKAKSHLFDPPLLRSPPHKTDHRTKLVLLLAKPIHVQPQQTQQKIGCHLTRSIQVEVLSCIRHPNMVLLLGACPEYGCLVYEFMANGSLEDCLFRGGKAGVLPWQLRFRIAAEIGTGLLFLHQTKPEPLVHRDLKPGNILLDRNFVSKISDVGLARLVPPSVANTVTQYRMTSTAGTF